VDICGSIKWINLRRAQHNICYSMTAFMEVIYHTLVSTLYVFQMFLEYKYHCEGVEDIAVLLFTHSIYFLVLTSVVS